MSHFEMLLLSKASLLIIFVYESFDPELLVGKLADNLEVIVIAAEKVETMQLFQKDSDGSVPHDGIVAFESNDHRSFHLVPLGETPVRFTVVRERVTREFQWHRLPAICYRLAFNFTKNPGPSIFPAPLMAAAENAHYASHYLKGQSPSPYIRDFMYFMS
jgi:hypothetical protein